MNLVLSKMTYGRVSTAGRVNIADSHQTACMSPWRSFKPHPKKQGDFNGLVLWNPTDFGAVTTGLNHTKPALPLSLGKPKEWGGGKKSVRPQEKSWNRTKVSGSVPVL